MHRRTFLRSGAAALSLPAVDPAAASDPYRPLSVLDLPRAKDATVQGTTAYVAVASGYAVADVTDPRSPELLARVDGIEDDHPDGPLRAVHDVQVDGDRLVAVGPSNPNLSQLQGFALYDVSDPADPEQAAFEAVDGGIHNCVLEGEHLYFPRTGSVNEPLVVYDVGDDPEQVGEWSIVDHDDRYATVQHGLYQLHDLWVQDGLAYLAHWDAGVQVLDVSDPADPTHVSRFGGLGPERLQAVTGEGAEAVRAEGLQPPGNVHTVVLDGAGTLLAVGTESWDLDPADGRGGPGGVDLWDVSDPADPEQVATIDPPPSPTGDQTRDGDFTTAHNVDFADGRLYSSWYHGGVKVHDVSDPAEPAELTWWQRPDEAKFWTAESVVPGEHFVASDMGVADDASDAGLYVFPDREAPDADPSRAGVATPTATPTGTASPTETAETESTPGFGALAALAAGGLAAGGLAARRLRK